MATYQFSALADGQAISFNPAADVLNFDQISIAAAETRITVEGANLRITVGVKDVLLNNVSAQQLATTNVTFADGSRLLFGDNSAGTSADNAANSLTGTAGDDQLMGFGGADTLSGGAGSDVYFVGAGDAIVDSGFGDTNVVYSEVSWTLGTDLDDLFGLGTTGLLLRGNDGLNRITGTSGNDTIDGLGTPDTLDGGAGNDTLLGGTGDDRFHFAAAQNYGVDHIDGGLGWDLISFETTGRSAIQADLAAGTLTGGGAGGSGSATLIGIEGVWGSPFADRIFTTLFASGFGGNDTLSGGDAGISLEGGDGDDELHGGAGNDWLNAGLGTDTVLGGAGDDVILGSLIEGDFVDGGAGRDSVSTGAHTAVTIDLGGGTLTGGDVGGRNTATILNIEDAAVGTGLANRLIGSSGANSLSSTAVFGDDTLNGAAGNDTLQGGGGADAFVFSHAGAANADLVVDFAPGTDKVVLDPAAYTALGADGAFASADARFWSSTTGTAHDSSDRVIYNSGSGQLWYDADGNGAAAAQLVATLQGAPTLSATDIFAGADLPGVPRPQFEVRTVMDHGASANRVDIVFMGDGYTAAQLPTYSAQVNDLIAYMFDDSLVTQPFGRYESFFNIHVVDVISNESGVSRPGAPRDTALGTRIEASGLMLPNYSLAATVLSDAIEGTDIEAEMRMLAVNDFGGGIAGTFAVYSANSAGARDVALHEVGHQFAGLGDQYWTSGTRWIGTSDPEDPDLTIDASGSKWERWLGYDQPGIGVIGAYEGGGHTETGIYRPSLNSKMRSVNQPFDAIGREAFILKFYDLLDPLDGYLANSGTLENADEFWVDTIDPSIIHVDWTINGTTYADRGERISLSALGYDEAGNYTVTARAYDPTDWVRVPDRSSLEQTVQWQVANDAGEPGGENDSITGTSGNDTIDGGAGDDTINGLAGNDSLIGGAGNDSLDGGAGTDTLNGGEGNDSYVVTAGDVISDVGGFDTVFSDVAWTLAAGLENLTLTGTAAVAANGNNANNVLTGNSGNNYFNARAGSDIILGGAGNDTIDMSTGGTPLQGNDSVDGGGGIDTVDYDGYARSSVNADLISGVVAGGGDAGEGRAQIAGIERFIGGAFNDQIAGSAGGEYLDGRGGNDTIDGLGGNDTLIGGAGADSLRFSVAPGSANADQVTGFVSGTDKLILDGAGHAGIGANGAFVAGDARFWSSTTGAAHDASDRVIYNTTSGQLWYDADGNGAGTAQLIATLQGASALAATDITVSGGMPPGQTINGTSGNDSLVGTAGDDTISGFGGNDTLDGSEGADLLIGGDGNDVLSAPPNAHGDQAADTLDGGLGDDDYFVSDDGDTVLADPGGFDTVHAINSPWTLADGLENLELSSTSDTGFDGTGNNLDNRITTGAFVHLQGLGGNDFLDAGRESWLEGGAGNDTLLAAGTLSGGSGNDKFVFYPPFLDDPVLNDSSTITDFVSASDTVVLDGQFGGTVGATGRFAAGDARFWASSTGAAHDASDRVIYNTTTGELWWDEDGNGSGAAQQIAVLQGTPALAATDIEVINGGQAGTSINGTAGNDSLVGTAGDDTINGLGGNDTLSGLAGDDRLNGGAGADSIIGGNGNDSLSGQAGIDRLQGGAGNDAFVFDVLGSENRDIVLDFASGVDKLVMENAVMTAIGATGNFAAGDARFWAAAGATSGHDANDRIVYNTTSGDLYYDADGSGAGATRFLGNISGHPTLAATDIAVI